jgi:hypothetical protein
MEKYIVYQCWASKKAARRGSRSSSATLAGGFPGWIRASSRHRSFIREIFFLVQAQPLQGQMEFHYWSPTALYRDIYIWQRDSSIASREYSFLLGLGEKGSNGNQAGINAYDR